MSSENNTMYGFWFCVIVLLLSVACWGSPDLVDAWIYYLSDGFYKSSQDYCILEVLDESSVDIGDPASTADELLFTLVFVLD